MLLKVDYLVQDRSSGHVRPGTNCQNADDIDQDVKKHGQEIIFHLWNGFVDTDKHEFEDCHCCAKQWNVGEMQVFDKQTETANYLR